MLGKIDASLDAKLKNVKWGKYKLEELFESYNGNFDIQKEHINGNGTFVITAGETNNGILGKTDVEARIFPKKTITIDMFGNVYYRNFDYKLVTHARVFSLISKFELEYKQGLFIESCLSFLHYLYGYENMCSWKKIKKVSIELPINNNNEIDFPFMESLISELEEERISELSTYLKVSGLENYLLTPEEQEVIDNYSKIEFKDYKITDVFNIKNTKNILSRDVVLDSGKIPYLCASAENNSVASYIEYDKNLIDEGNCVFIGGKTFVVSYQENDFYSNDSHNLALYLKDYNKTKLNQLYLATCVKKSLSHKYSWGNSVSGAKIKNDLISLPTIDGKVDYNTMDNFISAIQKLVIKDVVEYTDRKLNTTKRIVNNRS